jgi:hypothetical protein
VSAIGQSFGLKGHHGIEDDISDTTLEKHPLPSLQGLEGPIDLAKNSHFLDSVGFESEGIGSPAVRKESRSKSRKKKSKKTKKGKTRRKEVDDCRPDSDKHQFVSLHAAKEARRIAERSSRNMAGTRSNRTSSDQENVTPGSVGGDSAASTQQLSKDDRFKKLLDEFSPDMQKKYSFQLGEILRKDKKLSADKVRSNLTQQRKANFYLKAKNETLAEYKRKHEEVSEENAKLRQQLEARVSKSKAMVMRESEGEKERISKVVNTELWRVMKFINCKEDEDDAIEFTYKALYDTEPLDLDKMYSWGETYKKYIRECLYGKRNYVASQIKVCAWKLFEAQENLPTVEQVQKCINRTINVEDEREMEIFKWYWECLLPRVVGAVEWGPSVRLYNMISTYYIPHDAKGRLLITPSNEAMILILWENSFAKWHELWTFSQNPANRGKKQKNRGGKFTSCEKGQCDFSGWDAEGIEAFNAYVQEAKDGRHLPNRLVLEKQTLQALRQQYNIHQPDAEAQARANRARKRRRLANDAPLQAPSRRIVRAFMDAD